jgi:hypothetical protein
MLKIEHDESELRGTNKAGTYRVSGARFGAALAGGSTGRRDGRFDIDFSDGSTGAFSAADPAVFARWMKVSYPFFSKAMVRADVVAVPIFIEL